MMYSDDDCLLFFTSEQSHFMNISLENFRPGLLEEPSLCQKEGLSDMNDLELVVFLQDNQLLMVEPKGREEVDTRLVFRIFDCTGRMLLQRDLQMNSISPFRVMEFPSGIYFLNLKWGLTDYSQVALECAKWSKMGYNGRFDPCIN